MYPHQFCASEVTLVISNCSLLLFFSPFDVRRGILMCEGHLQGTLYNTVSGRFVNCMFLFFLSLSLLHSLSLYSLSLPHSPFSLHFSVSVHVFVCVSLSLFNSLIISLLPSSISLVTFIVVKDRNGVVMLPPGPKAIT